MGVGAVVLVSSQLVAGGEISALVVLCVNFRGLSTHRIPVDLSLPEVGVGASE